jgi:hypothetical protein
MSSTFFESLASILSSKKYWLDKEHEAEYAPVGVLIGLSQHLDSILYVNEMNIWWRNVSPRMHYDYFFYSIRKMHRKFGKWAKKINDDDLALVMHVYQVNRDKAQDILELLSPDQLKEVKDYAIGFD